MKSFCRPFPFAVLPLVGVLTFGPILRAEDPPPPADHKPEVAQPAPAPAKVEPALAPAPESSPAASPSVAQPKTPPAPGEPAEVAGKPVEMTQADDGQTAQKAPEAAPAQEKAPPRRHRTTRDSSGDSVAVMNDNQVPAGVTVTGDAVAVIGNLTVDGEVNNDAVAVMGDNTINGIVHGNVVAVMGDVTLGPKARIEGDLIDVGGVLHRDPGAMVEGQVKVIPFGSKLKLDSVNSWWIHGLKYGRPLAIGAHLGWLWIMTGFSVAFYALLALIFPASIRSCGNKLVQQPGLTILAAVLGMLALPVLFILLCITIIGIPVALLLLPLACVLAVLYGKAAVYTLVGLRISRDRLHPAVAAIVGALIFILFYLVPFAGLLLSLLVSLIGFGCVILTLFARAPKAAPPAAAPVPPVEPGVPPVLPETPVVPAPATPFSASLPPVVSAATLPRAGFWIRVAAALLDLVLIGIVLGMTDGMFRRMGFHPGDAFPLWVVLYSVVMWAKKGTTIGGIICGLKVVRLDDRPVDWGVAIVRALSAFLSLAMAGLGFIWVAFDDDKQSWHDKIAGTTIVRVPKGTALL